MPERHWLDTLVREAREGPPPPTPALIPIPTTDAPRGLLDEWLEKLKALFAAPAKEEGQP